MRLLLLERDDRCCAACGNRFTKQEGQQADFDEVDAGEWRADNLVLVHYARKCPYPSPSRVRAGLVVGPPVNRSGRKKADRSRKIMLLMARDGELCQICLKPFSVTEEPTFDHVIARSLGGGSDLANLRLAHQLCNNRRGNDDGEAWRAAHPRADVRLRPLKPDAHELAVAAYRSNEMLDIDADDRLQLPA